MTTNARCTILVYSGASMVRARTRIPAGKREHANCVRASVSFDGGDYAELERIAEAKRVSVAWVVREAVSMYLGEGNPLFRNDESAKGQT